jgi:hypothetical protein
LVLPDKTPIYAVLGAVAANYLPGDPVWLGVVAPPSSAKTEILNSILLLPDVVPIATLTVGALLSGTSKKARDKHAKGSLLRAVDKFGIAGLKDFGSILSLHTETRAEVLAALREIFDGAWTRHVGTDGGKTLHWSGKLGLVFGSTPAIDGYHAVIGSLGDRWLLSRMAPIRGKRQPVRDFEAERLGGLDADHQLELCRQYDRQIGGLLALENLARYSCRQGGSRDKRPDPPLPATEAPILTTPITLSGGTLRALPTLLPFSFLPSRLLAST